MTFWLVFPKPAVPKSTSLKHFSETRKRAFICLALSYSSNLNFHRILAIISLELVHNTMYIFIRCCPFAIEIKIYKSLIGGSVAACIFNTRINQPMSVQELTGSILKHFTSSYFCNDTPGSLEGIVFYLKLIFNISECVKD